MSFIFSRALAEESLQANCWEIDAYAPLNLIPTPKRSLSPGKTTAPFLHSRFGMTFEPLTDADGEELLTLWLADFRAKTSVQREPAKESTASEADSGPKWLGSFARYDRESSLWKTAQCSLLGDSDEFLETWPRWGSMRNGESFLRRIPALPICESESGFSERFPTPIRNDAEKRGNFDPILSYGLAGHVKLWPTPQAHDAQKGYADRVGRFGTKYGGRNLNDEVKMWPTPCASASKGSSPAALTRKSGKDRSNDRIDHAVMATDGGQLNPEWVELLMGWPKGYTDLIPLPKEEFDAWFEGFAGQDLRDVRRTVQSSCDAERTDSGCEAVSCAETLQQNMRQQQEGTQAAELSMAREEAPESSMRGVRLHEAADSSSLRSGSDEQRSGESANPVQSLPRLLARYGQAAWQGGSWEDGVPRVITGMAHRSHRIKSLGNGQVPRVAAAAFTILSS